MKAIRVHEFGGTKVRKLEAVPALEPGAGQVVVRVKAAGVNPVDTYIRTGTYAHKPALPYTPGPDAAPWTTGSLNSAACTSPTSIPSAATSA